MIFIMEPTRIFLVDDHRLFSSGLRALLARAGGYKVVGEADNPEAAIERCGAAAPDIAVVDVHLRAHGDGIGLAAQLRAALPALKILFLSSDADFALVRKAIEAGGSGYLLKAGAPQDLVRALEAVRADQVFLAPEVAAALVKDYRHHLEEERSPGRPRLSERERQVLPLLADGLQNKQIAEQLGVSVKSIETYRSRLMAKLGLTSTAELVRYAIREGIVKP